MYLYASDNKKADTVQDYFLRAVAEHGWPLRIRTDKAAKMP